MNRAQVVDEKNGVTFVGSFIMFTPGVIVISYSLRASERLYLALSENGVEYWLLSCQ